MIRDACCVDEGDGSPSGRLGPRARHETRTSTRVAASSRLPSPYPWWSGNGSGCVGGQVGDCPSRTVPWWPRSQSLVPEDAA